MALVAYPDSEDDEHAESGSSKKRKLSHNKDDVPPLPTSFHNLYASTVRVSTTDDPALHGGRKRIVPHVEGNWSTHVYLEWHPSPAEHSVLTRLLRTISSAPTAHPSRSEGTTATALHSLLQTQLGVPLPLHISLSRPLLLRTETKASFLTSLRDALTALTGRYEGGISLSPTTVSWHGNEDGSRAFLVLRVGPSNLAPKSPVQDEAETARQPDTLRTLLKVCNRVAAAFDQPLLYARQRDSDSDKREDSSKVSDDSDVSSSFHISVAWALPTPLCPVMALESREVETNIPGGEHIMKEVRRLRIRFDAVKIRIGKDVSDLPFGVKRSNWSRP